jgi:hypothetical protein
MGKASAASLVTLDAVRGLDTLSIDAVEAGVVGPGETGGDRECIHDEWRHRAHFRVIEPSRGCPCAIDTILSDLPHSEEKILPFPGERHVFDTERRGGIAIDANRVDKSGGRSAGSSIGEHVDFVMCVRFVIVVDRNVDI